MLLLEDVKTVFEAQGSQFVPRVDHAQWHNAAEEHTAAEPYPPGFVYEDVLEFLLEVFKYAYFGRNGKNFQGRDDKTLGEEEKKLGEKNMKDVQLVIAKIVEND